MFSVSTSVDDYISIVLTNECNRACRFCIDSYRGEQGMMTTDSFDRALAVVRRKKIRDVLLVGGEPTLHPRLREWAGMLRDLGVNVIVTTNFDNLDAVYALDGPASSINLSYYGQKKLPDPSRFHSTDLTLSTLIHRTGFIRDLNGLDSFIDRYGDSYTLKFSTLAQINSFTRKNGVADWLDDIDGEKVVLFNEIEGIIHRGCIIKRYDRVVNENADQSIKVHRNGHVNRTWNNSYDEFDQIMNS